jgi:hypothetical protein
MSVASILKAKGTEVATASAETTLAEIAGLLISAASARW